MNRNATWPAEKGGHQQCHKGRTHLKKELRTPNSKLFGEKGGATASGRKTCFPGHVMHFTPAGFGAPHVIDSHRTTHVR